MEVTQLALTWGWVAKWWKTCFDLRANLISTKVSAIQRKCTQVHAMPADQTESQEDSSFLYLRLLANPFGQGLELPTIPKTLSGKIRGLIPWSLAYKICSTTRGLQIWVIFQTLRYTIQETSSVIGVFGTSFRINQDQEQSRAVKYESWRHKRAGFVVENIDYK